MCTGDLTPEPALIDGAYYNGPTPWGAKHTCVDFNAVRTQVIENRYRGYLLMPVDEERRIAYTEHRILYGQGKVHSPLPPP